MRFSPLLAALSLSLVAGTALAQNEPPQADQPGHSEKATPAPHATKHRATPLHKKAAAPKSHKILHPKAHKASPKPADPDAMHHE